MTNWRPLLALFGVLAAGASAVLACGSLVDPAKVSTVADAAVVLASRPLTGTLATAPARPTRVALVWRTNKYDLVVGADVAVDASGAFTLNLEPPPASYLTYIDPEGFAAEIGGTDLPWPYGFEVDAGAESSPLEVATAGVIAYEDTNGNGAFDLDVASRGTSDSIVGGAYDLVITYFAGGSALDYQKMQSGLVPQPGFNLEWTLPEVWVQLDTLQLKLDYTDKSTLPPTVCGDIEPILQRAVADAGSSVYPPAQYASCRDDGLLFMAKAGWDVSVCRPAPRTVCTTTDLDECKLGGILSGSWLAQFDAGEPLPDGWPCTSDAGAPDAGL